MVANATGSFFILIILIEMGISWLFEELNESKRKKIKTSFRRKEQAGLFMSIAGNGNCQKY
jgi:hypothetical protein